MDPTQNKDSFDSFGPGGNNTGGPVGGQAASVAPPVGGEQGASVTNNGTITSNPMAPTGLNQMGMSSTNGVNSGFGQANFGALVGSNTGDIVVGDDSKKSKNGLAIGLIVVFVIAIIAVLVLFLSKNVINVVSKDELKVSFNKFANYVISGQELDTDINPELDYSYNYFLNKYDIDNKEDMYENTKKLFLNFEEKYNRYNNKDELTRFREYLDGMISTEGDLAVFMSRVYIKDLPSMMDVLADYARNGRNDALVKYKNYYYLNDVDNNEYITTFSSDYNDWLDKNIELFDLYNSSGCINNTDILVSCALGEQNRDFVSDSIENIDLLYESLEDSYDFSNGFIKIVYVINSLINGGDASDYVFIVDKNDEENGGLVE